MSAFVYEPIDSNEHQIRLLKILPRLPTSTESLLVDLDKLLSSQFANASEDIVNCTLEAVSLHNCPKFFALSYTWGDAKTLKSIEIESINDKNKRTLKVTTNLEMALRHIRRERDPVCIWVDAICINQSDEEEKSGQVRVMREIYEGSTSTLVWVGLAAEESDAAMDGLDRIGRKAFEAGILDLRKDDYLNWPLPDAEEPRSATQEAIDNLVDENDDPFPYSALQSLSERSYWTRIWILQEIAAPKEVVFVCGFKQLKYHHFVAAIMFLARKRSCISQRVTAADVADPQRWAALTPMLNSTINPALGVIIGARRKFQDIKERDSLVQLLARGCIVASEVRSDLQASDPRDKIFGLLGLSSDRDDLNIIPNYSKSTVETYVNAARALITHGHTDILAWCQKLDDPALQSLPSWVPDFSSPIRDPCGNSMKSRLFSTSGHLGVSCLPVVSNVYSPILAITGSTVDTVESLGSHWAPGLSCQFNYLAAKDFFNHIDEFCDRSHGRPSSLLQDPDRLMEAKFRIPCADQVFIPSALRCRIPTTTSTTMAGYHELKQ